MTDNTNTPVAEGCTVSNERQTGLTDEFRGDDAHLIRSIEALIELNDEGALVPHGIGGHARALLSAAAVRLAAQSADARNGEGAAVRADKERAYHSIDRFLRNNLCDEDYAEYSAELDSLLAAPSSPAPVPRLWPSRASSMRRGTGGMRLRICMPHGRQKRCR